MEAGPIYTIEDFSRWENTEYVSDFVRPAGVERVLSMITGRYQIAVLRSRRDPPFTETDALVLKVLHPHVNNLFRLYSAPASFQNASVREVETAGGTLTRREAQVAVCLFRRMTSRGIGAALGMSHRTAERHVQNMYEKLSVRSRTELLELLSESRLVCPPD
jgi:DNA-binding NarL/FixJ family response regulator